MLKRHEIQVWTRLDELYVKGVVFISWWELYHWYSIQRISKTPYRDLMRKWSQLLQEKQEAEIDPQVAILRGGIALFSCRQPKTLADLAD